MADNYDENKPMFPYWQKAPIDPYDSLTSRIPNTTPSLDNYDWQASRIEKMDELIRSYSESYSLISKAELDYERLRQLNVESSRNFDYAGMAMAAAGAAAKAQLGGAAIGLIGGIFGMPAGAVDPLKPDPAMAMLASVKNSILYGYSGKGVGPKNKLPEEMFVDSIREKNVREQTLDEWQHQLVANITSAVGNKYSKGIEIDVASALGIDVPPGIPTTISLLDRSYRGGDINALAGGLGPLEQEKRIGDNLFATDISTNSFARFVTHAIKDAWPIRNYNNVDVSAEDSVKYFEKRVKAELGRSRWEWSMIRRATPMEIWNLNWLLFNKWGDPDDPNKKEYTSAEAIPVDVTYFNYLGVGGPTTRKSYAHTSLNRRAPLSLTPPELGGSGKKTANKYYADYGKSYVPKEINKEKFPFSIKNMSNGRTVYFPAYINVLNESISPSWNSMSFINRSEDFFVYQKTDRSLNIEFFLFAGASGNSVSSVSKDALGYDITASKEWNTPAQTAADTTNLPPVITHEKMWELINELHRFSRPNYYSPDTNSEELKFVTGSYLRITIGDMYKSQLAIMENLNITYDPLIWNMNSQDKLAPMVASITLGFKLMHDKVPTSNSIFYGHVVS